MEKKVLVKNAFYQKFELMKNENLMLMNTKSKKRSGQKISACKDTQNRELRDTRER